MPRGHSRPTSRDEIDDAYIAPDWMKKAVAVVDPSIWDATFETFCSRRRYVKELAISMERTMTLSVMVDRGPAKEEEIIDSGKVIAGETGGVATTTT